MYWPREEIFWIIFGAPVIITRRKNSFLPNKIHETFPKNFWFFSNDHLQLEKNIHQIIIDKNNEEEVIDIKGPEHLFFFEAELASQSIAKEKLQAPHPAMSWEDTLGNLKALDQWRNKVNYKLPQDEL